MMEKKRLRIDYRILSYILLTIACVLLGFILGQRNPMLVGATNFSGSNVTYNENQFLYHDDTWQDQYLSIYADNNNNYKLSMVAYPKDSYFDLQNIVYYNCTFNNNIITCTSVLTINANSYTNNNSSTFTFTINNNNVVFQTTFGTPRTFDIVNTYTEQQYLNYGTEQYNSGVQNVQNNPHSYGLYTTSEYNTNYTDGYDDGYQDAMDTLVSQGFYYSWIIDGTYDNDIRATYMWNDGTNYYYNIYSRSLAFNKSTYTFSPVTWNIQNVDGSMIYHINGNTYYGTGNNNQNYQFLNGQFVSFSPNINIAGKYVWSDGINTYYSFNSNHYIYNNGTWESITWNVNIRGDQIWNLNGETYYTYLMERYKLNKSTMQWESVNITGYNGNVNGEAVYVYNDHAFYGGNGSSVRVLNTDLMQWDLVSESTCQSNYGFCPIFYQSTADYYTIDNVVFQILYGQISHYGLTATYETGYELGYDDGYDDGYDVGYDDGYDDGVTIGENNVINNPNNYNLYTQNQYTNYGDAQYTAGENAVIDNPNEYDLYNQTQLETAEQNSYSDGYNDGVDSYQYQEVIPTFTGELFYSCVVNNENTWCQASDSITNQSTIDMSDYASYTSNQSYPYTFSTLGTGYNVESFNYYIDMNVGQSAISTIAIPDSVEDVYIQFCSDYNSYYVLGEEYHYCKSIVTNVEDVPYDFWGINNVYYNYGIYVKNIQSIENGYRIINLSEYLVSTETTWRFMQIRLLNTSTIQTQYADFTITYVSSQLDSEAYNYGYQIGSTQGYKLGISTGQQDYYNKGYNEGYSSATKVGDNSLRGLAETVLTSPINMFKNIFNFEFLGVNIAGFILSIITLLVVVWLIKRLI